MNEISKAFEYAGNNVRTLVRNDEIWFVAKDVCDILEIGNPSEALKRLDPEDKALISTEGFRGSVNMITESGLYNLVLGSRKSEAKQFKRWVTQEVLPSIRKHGAYLTPSTLEQAIANPDFAIGLLTSLKSEKERREAAERQLDQQRPKVLFADSVEASKTSILIRELAVILKQNGINMGEKRLFEWLRTNGYLVKRAGTDRNTPTQRSMEMGLFEIRETPINHNNGSITISKTTKVTGKGQLYFINKFIQNMQIV